MVWARQKGASYLFLLFSFDFTEMGWALSPFLLSTEIPSVLQLLSVFKRCAPSKKYYLADHIIDHNKAMVPGMGADSPATGPGTCARSTARSGLGGRFVTGTDSVRRPECCRDEESLLQQDSCKAEIWPSDRVRTGHEPASEPRTCRGTSTCARASGW